MTTLILVIIVMPSLKFQPLPCCIISRQAPASRTHSADYVGRPSPSFHWHCVLVAVLDPCWAAQLIIVLLRLSSIIPLTGMSMVPLKLSW